jgi:rod shape-determining protein MreC
VQKDMSALTPDGLVGKVIAATDHAATILLISDENCGVAATLQTPEGASHPGIIRVVRGDRLSNMEQPRMVMSFLPKRLKVAPGWKVFTSGHGRLFPENVIVGEVVESKERELEIEAVIQPAVNLAALTDVFIVTGLKGAAAK